MHNLSYLLSLLALAVLFIFTGGQNQTTSSEVEQSATPEPTSTLVNVASSRSVTSEILLEPVFPTPVDDAGSGGMLPSLFPLNPTPVPQTVPSGSSFTIAQANLSQKFVGDGLCGCDLLVGQCDTLCCCDNDCSVASRVVFDCSTISSSEVCLDFEGVFRTSLSRCSCADSSLLCIVYEQDPSRLHYGPAVVVESTEQFSTLELLHRLPGDHGILLQLATHSSNYSVGDPILVVNNNTASPFYDTLTVPAPFNGVQCHDGNPITYLANRQYKCSRSLDNLSTECATLSALAYVDLSLLQIPDHLIRDEIYGDIPLVLSSVSCRINSTSFQPCELMSAVFDPDTNVCRKSVLQASFIFVHDGRGCLLNASVIFFLGEVGEGSLTQQFTVKFIEDINSTVKQLKRSGNPGYVSGETILAGALTELGIDITIDSSFWLHVKGSGRRCTEERPRIPVQFGQDLVTSCLMVVSLSDLVTDCPGVRRRAYSVLSMDIFLDHVGRYGNSDPTNISQWLRIINETVDAMPSLRDLCTGVPTRLDITILYSNTGDFMQPQPVLSGIRFIYFTQNIASELIQSGNLVMSTSVRYIDVSAESIQVLPAVTATVMELPQDFLYPFFVSSAVTFLVPSSVVSLTALLLGLLVHLQGGV